MLTCPLCRNNLESKIEKCPRCGEKLIEKSTMKARNNSRKSIEINDNAIEIVGDIVEGVIEAVIDGIT